MKVNATGHQSAEENPVDRLRDDATRLFAVVCEWLHFQPPSLPVICLSTLRFPPGIKTTSKPVCVWETEHPKDLADALQLFLLR